MTFYLLLYSLLLLPQQYSASINCSYKFWRVDLMATDVNTWRGDIEKWMSNYIHDDRPSWTNAFTHLFVMGLLHEKITLRSCCNEGKAVLERFNKKRPTTVQNALPTQSQWWCHANNSKKLAPPSNIARGCKRLKGHKWIANKQHPIMTTTNHDNNQLWCKRKKENQ